MKLTPYQKALKMGKEKLSEMLVPVKVNRAKKQAELEMCKLDEEIAVKEAEIHELCTSENVDFAKLIDKQNSLALTERRREQYEKILAEMFPDES